ncbi:hypothetical protein ACFYM2_21295 [Streptomyces sp. NPDC006711]|uniref:hypothetical protein n=1 Tax=Streptomyces sp. NPDC006711 TaxID=3364762 RepID=UPI003690ED0C
MTDLPDRLRTVLTERFTELGNPFSAMRRHEQGPDGWPASHPVGPHQVPEVLRELLATDQAALPAPADRAAEADTIGLCGHCGVPRESHHHGYVSTVAALAAAPGRITVTDWAPLLTDNERQFLTFALDQAAEEMSLADGFTDEDEAALAKFRRMADAAQQPEEAGR